jgi:aminoglycoside/choline kinase family phosphotransferase
MKETTAKECLQAAFQATLRGDYTERDRLCKRGQMLAQAEHHAAAVERVLAIDFFVTAQGVSIPTLTMAKAAGAIQ